MVCCSSFYSGSLTVSLGPLGLFGYPVVYLGSLQCARPLHGLSVSLTGVPAEPQREGGCQKYEPGCSKSQPESLTRGTVARLGVALKGFWPIDLNSHWPFNPICEKPEGVGNYHPSVPVLKRTRACCITRSPVVVTACPDGSQEPQMGRRGPGGSQASCLLQCNRAPRLHCRRLETARNKGSAVLKIDPRISSWTLLRTARLWVTHRRSAIITEPRRSHNQPR